MAKKKKEVKKYFDCNTCTEKQTVLGVDVCSLRVKELDEYNLPDTSSFCENVTECQYYRKGR